MLLQVILEGLGLGVLLVLICAAGIRKGAVGMVHLYSPAVQQRCVKLGLTSPERIRRNSLLFKAVCVPGYISYVLVCVYGINGARSFAAGFWQLLVILSVMNLIDRFLIDGYWVGHTNAWTIPGTEDLKPYITAKKQAEKVAIRHGGHGSHSDGAGGDDDYFYSLREEPMKYKIEEKHRAGDADPPTVFPEAVYRAVSEPLPRRNSGASDRPDRLRLFRGREKLPQPDAAVRCAGGRHAAE